MRLLGVLAAWGVLAVLATMCFALGGSIGYRRGVKDTLTQIRNRRNGSAACRPLPLDHLRRRSSGHARPGARARRLRWRAPGVAAGGSRGTAVTADRRAVAALAGVVALMLVVVPGTAVGAATAQPGEALYPVKLGMEEIRLAVAIGPERDADVRIDLVAARLAELTSLVAGDGTATVIGQVYDDLEEHTMAAAAILRDAPGIPDRSVLRERLAALTAEQGDVLSDAADAACVDYDDGHCVALTQTRDQSEKLTTTATAAAVAVVDGELMRPETTVQADAQESAAPTPSAAPAAGDGDGGAASKPADKEPADQKTPEPAQAGSTPGDQKPSTGSDGPASGGGDGGDEPAPDQPATPAPPDGDGGSTEPDGPSAPSPTPSPPASPSPAPTKDAEPQAAGSAAPGPASPDRAPTKPSGDGAAADTAELAQ